MAKPCKKLAFVFYLVLNLFEINCVLDNGGNGSNDGNGGNDLNDFDEENQTLPPLGPLGITPNRFEPYFDTTIQRNISALIGKSAHLNCRVRNLGNKTVSWIRHRDLHILTVGTYTYTSDQRFQANHHKETDEWTLTVKWSQKRDGGIYECQISTQPVRSYFVKLNVVEALAGDEPQRVIENKTKCSCIGLNKAGPGARLFIFAKIPSATILGGPDMHVDIESTINLTCVIRFCPETPAYIFWYHQDDIYAKGGTDDGSARIIALIRNNKVISYDSSRGGVSIFTEKGDITISCLLIQHARLTDSGKYSCSPSNADVANIRVHVLNGERPAAIQTGSAGLTNNSLNIVILVIFYFYQIVYLTNDLQLQLINIWFLWR